MKSCRDRRLPAALMAVVVSVAACDSGGGGPAGPDPLLPDVELVLEDALQDEYRTYYTYSSIVGDFGSVAPFSTVVVAEKSLVEDLEALYMAFDATLPTSRWSEANVPRYLSLQEACVAAEESEVATILMYDRLLQSVSLPAQIRARWQEHRRIASENHLPAFRQCAGGGAAPVGTAVTAAMEEAIQDEYRAFFTYSRVLDDLGSVGPFVNIRDAEWVHVGAIASLYVKREMPVPASDWNAANVPGYGTVQEACAAGVVGEIDNVMMYDDLLLLDLPTDVERVFENLREASLEKHLPAFELCAETGTAPVGSTVREAMDEAIQDEYRAFFTYSGVVEDLEDDHPFSVIRDAEESHYTAIGNLYAKRGLEVPESSWSLANVARFATLIAACAAAVQGEEDNIAMYDRLLALELPSDVVNVFQKLRAASAEKHLPAFQSCAGG